MLADYVVVLLKKELPEEELLLHCKENLTAFLQDATSEFVDALFEAVACGPDGCAIDLYFEDFVSAVVALEACPPCSEGARAGRGVSRACAISNTSRAPSISSECTRTTPSMVALRSVPVRASLTARPHARDGAPQRVQRRRARERRVRLAGQRSPALDARRAVLVHAALAALAALRSVCP